VRKVLQGLEKWEIESGKWTEEQMEKPQVRSRIGELIQKGYDEMSATHMAVRETLGDEAYFKGLKGLSSYKDLQRLAPRS